MNTVLIRSWRSSHPVVQRSNLYLHTLIPAANPLRLGLGREQRKAALLNTTPRMNRLSHEERTTGEHRRPDHHRVVVSSVETVGNGNIRVLRLRKLDKAGTLEFLPGQWLDVFVPGCSKAGGFTITSTPKDAEGEDGFVQLAIQKAPWNPPAEWLWKPFPEIHDAPLLVRVGGNFTWPPPNIDIATIERVVFVAGGVGINPLISIVLHLCQTKSLPSESRFLYASKICGKDLSSVLFLSELQALHSELDSKLHELKVFLTKSVDDEEPADLAPYGSTTAQTSAISVANRRLTEADLWQALGSEQQRPRCLAYVCGPPALTDWAVEALSSALGVKAENILCEKWW